MSPACKVCTAVLIGMIAFLVALGHRIYEESGPEFDRLVALGTENHKTALNGNRPRRKEYLIVLFCEDSKTRIDGAELVKWIETPPFGPKRGKTTITAFDSKVKHEWPGIKVNPIFPKEICGTISYPKDDKHRLERHVAKLESKFSKIEFHAYETDTQTYTDYGEYNGPAVREWVPSRLKDWDHKIASPYKIVLTAFPKKTNISYEEWQYNWDKKQAPMSEMIQPRAKYVRHRLVSNMTEHAPKYDAIVLESWPTIKHMVDFKLFFFGEESYYKTLLHMTVMMRGVLGIMDFDKMQGAALSEYSL